MSCWDVLARRAKVNRDKAAESVAQIRTAIEEQEVLRSRTQEIANQYEQKIGATQGPATHFGDIQLYRTSLRQMQQAICYIQTQIAKLELDLKGRQRALSLAEIERQKYQKLVEREEIQVAKSIAHRESRELDEIGAQRYHRKSKLA